MRILIWQVIAFVVLDILTITSALIFEDVRSVGLVDFLFSALHEVALTRTDTSLKVIGVERLCSWLLLCCSRCRSHFDAELTH